MPKTLYINGSDGKPSVLTVPDDFDPAKASDWLDANSPILTYQGIDGDLIVINWRGVRSAYLTNKAPADNPPPPSGQSNLVQIDAFGG